MKKLIFSIMTLFLMSCGTIVNYDYEKSTDFSDYKSYAYFTDMKTGLSPFDMKRLTTAVDAKLKTMGFSKSDNPDFYIDISSQDIQNRNSPSVGVGVGGSGRNVGGGVSIGLPIGTNQNTRELVIEFVDDNKSGMFWQAISENTYKPNASPE